MPFRSRAQRAYLEIHDPAVAQEFAAHTSAKQEKSLPKRKAKAKPKRVKNGHYGH